MNKKGFTLVELLVVIAIIGILSSVAVVNLNSARDKAKFAAAQATVSQMTTPIIMCLDAGTPISQPTAAGGTAVCADYSTNWAPLGNSDYAYTSTGFTSSVSAMTWSFTISGGVMGPITCTQNGCQSS